MPGVYKEEPSRAVKYIGPESDRNDSAQGPGAGGGFDTSPTGLADFLAINPDEHSAVFGAERSST